MHFFVDDIAKVYTKLESEGEITKKEIWNNLLGKKKTVNFTACGSKFSSLKIWLQKPLCGAIYGLIYPRLYFYYRIGKHQNKKWHKMESSLLKSHAESRL